MKRGDTLYAIALDHGLDYRELAAWNNLENVNVIRVGQVLRLSAPGEPAPAGAAGVQTAPLKVVPPVVAGDARTVPPPPAPSAVDSSARNSESYKTQPKALKEPYSEQAMRDVARCGGRQHRTAAPFRRRPRKRAPGGERDRAEPAPGTRASCHRRQRRAEGPPGRQPTTATTGSTGCGRPRAGS